MIFGCNLLGETFDEKLHKFQGVWYAGKNKVKYSIEKDNIYRFEKGRKVLFVSKLTPIEIEDKDKKPIANTNLGPVYPSKVITYVGIYDGKDICEVNLEKGVLFIQPRRTTQMVMMKRKSEPEPAHK